MEQKPVVSVIIPCRDALTFVGRQLAALDGQVGAPCFEVLLIDNGMNAGIHAVAEGFPALNVRIISARLDVGTASARNRGVAEGRGNLLLFCDADDVVVPTWVRDGVEQLRRWPAFSGGAIPLEPEVFEADVETIWNTVLPLVQPCVKDLPSIGAGHYPILLGCSFGMTRDLALEIGGFDRSFASQGEDNDLAFRLIERLGYVPSAGHIAVAYRKRHVSEMRFARAFDAGMKHALVCARHQAWQVSPAYAGHWVARPVIRFVGDSLRGLRDVDGLGRYLGVVVGRMRFRGARHLPEPRLGTDDVGCWSHAEVTSPSNDPVAAVVEPVSPAMSAA